MKRISILLSFIIYFQAIKGQTYVTIPDANFVSWLQLKIPSAMNGSQMDITDPLVTGMTKMDIVGRNISDLTGIHYFSSLDSLDFSLNQISVAATLPNSITYINCQNCSLTGFSNLPASLKYLFCLRNQITSLPALPGTIIAINCSVNQLTTLPVLPGSIEFLDCSNNQITSLPALPNSLTRLYCAGNQLTSFTLPSLLQKLDCSNNLLAALPAFPASLNYLNCSNNQLTILPTLPNSLVNLYCSNNQLTGLPSLSNSLKELNCSHNQITNFSVLPILLEHLDCSYNLLTNLPSFPVGLVTLICSHNNISCFPPFPPIQYEYFPVAPADLLLMFDISANPFTCLPNYIPAMNNMLLSYPLCIPGDTVNNSNGCTEGKGISGQVYHDLNSDCFQNANELGITNATVKLYDNANVFMGMTNAFNNGLYYFNVVPGNYKVVLDTLNSPYRVQCVNPGIDSLVNLTAIQLEDSVNFAITCKPGFDIGLQAMYVTGSSFPSITHTLVMWAGDMSNWNNLKCAAGMSGTLSVTVSGPVTYVGPVVGALTPVVNGNVYTYIINNFGAINNYSDFKLMFKTNTTAQVGDSICVNAIISPVNGDTDPSNNIYNYCYPVRNSYDPNKKEVFPRLVMPGFHDWLTYTIHFKNTGTASAMNVRLLDTLDNFLDPETFQVMAYSHSNIINLINGVLTVRFPGIQLAPGIPASPASLGFIQYRIKPKANWVADTISNKAFIYFDYNAPIVTNTAKTYFMITTGVKGSEQTTSDLVLFPNPAKELLNISSQFKFDRVEVVNLTGQVLVSETVKDKTYQLQLQNLAEGIYFVKCTYANGMSITKKVVKQ